MVSLLTEEEKGGAEVPKEEEESVFRLAGHFYTKRVLNVDAGARTFKPLWRTVGELKIRDIGEHILLFEFEDILDLERVLEFEPWSYNKHLVAFECVFDIESVPFLDFSRATFWVQIHNIPKRSLKVEVGELIGISHNQAPWWRKRDSSKGPSNKNADNSKETQSSAHSTANMAMDYVEISKPMRGNGSNVNNVRALGYKAMR
nr:hypothetical protein CFP56_66977 [Quercus suber]